MTKNNSTRSVDIFEKFKSNINNFNNFDNLFIIKNINIMIMNFLRFMIKNDNKNKINFDINSTSVDLIESSVDNKINSYNELLYIYFNKWLLFIENRKKDEKYLNNLESIFFIKKQQFYFNNWRKKYKNINISKNFNRKIILKK